MGEKQSGTPLATPGAATTPFTFTHGKRGTEHLSEKCDGLAGELTVRSSRLARLAPPQGQSVVVRRHSRGGSARGEEKGMVPLVTVVEWRGPRLVHSYTARSPPNSRLADAMRASVSPRNLSLFHKIHIPLQI